MRSDPPDSVRNQIIEEIFAETLKIKSQEVTLPVFITDKNGEILSISDPTKDFLKENFELKISVGDTVFKIIPEEMLRDFGKSFNNVLQFSESQNFSYPMGADEVLLKLIPVLDKKFRVNKIQVIMDINREGAVSSNNRFQKILEQSLDLIVTLDEFGLFREVSAASYKILGYRPEELIGENYRDFIFPEDKEFSTITEIALKQGEEKNYIPNRFIHKNGSLVHLIWSAKWDAEDKLMYCIGKNASDLRELEMKTQEERSMLKAIIDNIPDHIFVIDQDHKTILTNKKFYSDYLGKNSEEDTLQLRPVDYFPENEGLAIMDDNTRVMETGIPVINRLDTVYDYKGNKDVILLTKVPFKDESGKVSGLVGIARNITDSYNLEREQKFVYKLINSLGHSASLESGFRKTIKLISKFLHFDAAEAWEVGYNNTTLLRSAGYKDPSENMFSNAEKSTFDIGEGLPGTTWKKGKIQIWHNLDNDDRFLRKESFSKRKLDMGIGVPIIFNEGVIAVLTFFGRSREHHGVNTKAVLRRLAFQISNDVQRKITENRLNDLFEHSPNLIAVVGKDGYLKKVNPAFTRVFGYREDELLGNPLVSFLHPAEKEATLARLKEVTEGLPPRSFQNRCLTKEGEWKWISWTPSFLLEKGIVHVFGNDVTTIKSTNLELLKYKNIIESSRDGIGLYSVGSREVFLNKAFKEILGYEEAELTGENSMEKVYVDINLASRIFEILISGNYWEGDLQLRSKSGSILDYYFSGGPIYNQKMELIAVFAIHTDISERKTYEAALKNYGARIENILESITDGFFSLDSSWEVTYWNNTAEKLLGVSREDILNKNLWDHFPAAKTLLFYSKYVEAMEMQKKMFFEEYFEPLEVWFEVNVYPADNGISVFFKDITDRKKADMEIKLAKDRYDLVARATREAVYDWNIESNVLIWSDSYYEIYGYPKISPEDALKQWELNIHPQDRESVIEKLNRSLNSTEEEWNCEYRLLQTDKKIAVILERGFILRDNTGKALRMIGSLQDITELTQNERALEELNFKLEKHSQELAMSNAELEQFAYIASHDLQEPLRMVTGFLTQLQRKYDEQLDDKARQYIYFATDGAVRMRQIILDLLDYSRVGRINYGYEDIDLNILLKDIIKLHENLIKESGTQIEYNDLPVIRAAAIPLQRVLSNLITNSIKYAKNGISPLIGIQVIDKIKKWEIIVSDNGIGIDELFQDKIFIIFQRLHSRDQYSGTGIGLAICKKIVENHGGKIWVVSKEGEGSTFHFTIPKHF
ncbi:MAG TPA: PAS domain S-box protein [Gillisia sp.]|nr:PAS domain S-box protein [Gillisia sp.]